MASSQSTTTPTYTHTYMRITQLCHMPAQRVRLAHPLHVEHHTGAATNLLHLYQSRHGARHIVFKREQRGALANHPRDTRPGIIESQPLYCGKFAGAPELPPNARLQAQTLQHAAPQSLKRKSSSAACDWPPSGLGPSRRMCPPSSPCEPLQDTGASNTMRSPAANTSPS